MAYVASYCCYS